MSAFAGPSDEVRRVLMRDDLLALAMQADRALAAVKPGDVVALPSDRGPTLFNLALGELLDFAATHKEWALKAQAWDYAAILVRFCRLVDADLVTDSTSTQLHERAISELRDDRPGHHVDKDLTRGVLSRHHAARDLRLQGRFDAALTLVNGPRSDLYGTGAEPHMAHYLFEVGAVHLAQGRSPSAAFHSPEWDEYWNRTRASGYSTRYRFDFICALALWNEAPDDEGVLRGLHTAQRRLRRGRLAKVPALVSGSEDTREDHAIQELSVVLSMAEYLAGRELAPEKCVRAVRLGERALQLADQVRSRWSVIARSRAPLTVVFQRIYGDLALLAQRLPGQAAAELGFRVALSAKQTGFAARIRDGLTFEGNPTIDMILSEIIRLEANKLDSYTSNPNRRIEQLEVLRDQLADAVSPMLAETVFPTPMKLNDLVAAIGRRYVLDYVELGGTADAAPLLFRTLIEPGGRMLFELVDPDVAFKAHFEGALKPRDHTAHDVFAEAGSPAPSGTRTVEAESPTGHVDLAGLDYRKLAEAVLPERLTREILVDAGVPISLLISAHAWLSLVPWAALCIDERDTRLIERAVIGQCPAMASLAAQPPGPVLGRALIRLVGQHEEGVDVRLERAAWGLDPVPAADEGLFECGVPRGSRARPYAARFDEALGEPGTWQFLHIASHGGGNGFDQYLEIAGERLSAAGALALKWPAAVLMASCHVGLVINDCGAEPLNFVMSMLTGGARCVVAGIGAVDDEGTGRVASRMVRAVRTGGVPLDTALRSAQLAAIRAGEAEACWALLSAYVS